jgi:hypothetical protein
MLVLFGARVRALLTTIALALAAPRVAGWLRHVGERQRRRGRPKLAWRAPEGVARALEQVAGRRRQGPVARRFAGVKRAGTAGVRRAGAVGTAGVKRAGAVGTAGVKRAGAVGTAGAKRAGRVLHRG